MDTKSYCVYSHTNKTNGKIYIGLTGLEPDERWRNGNGYHSETYFRNAIDKYGWNNFEHKIIKKNLTKDEAAYWEKYYISFYNSTNRNYGYNISSGGEAGGGHPQTEEARKKIGENGYHYGFLGKKHSDETKKKMSESRMGHATSDETKQKISEAHKRLRNRSVLCVELDCVFESLDEASDVTGCWKSGIVQCCKGKQKSCKGYHFKYAN